VSSTAGTRPPRPTIQIPVRRGPFATVRRWWLRLRKGPSFNPEQAGIYVDRRGNAFPWGMDYQEQVAAEQGAADALAGVVSPYATAVVPPTSAAIIERSKVNIANLRSDLLVRQHGLESMERDASQKVALLEAERDALAADLADSETRLADYPASRFGWARMQWWVLLPLAIAVCGADVLLTFLGVQAGLSIENWEIMVVSILAGVLLFAAGVGKGYLDTLIAKRKLDPDGDGIDVSSFHALNKWLIWPTVALLIGLALARWGLIVGARTLPDWIVALGGFTSVTAVAVMVTVTTYMGSKVVFAAQPRTRLQTRIRKLNRALEKAEKRRTKAQEVLDRIAPRRRDLPALFGAAATSAHTSWAAVLDAYWRAHGLEEPDKQMDVAAIHNAAKSEVDGIIAEYFASPVATPEGAS
jgi:hypothetical protein